MSSQNKGILDPNLKTTGAQVGGLVNGLMPQAKGGKKLPKGAIIEKLSDGLTYWKMPEDEDWQRYY